MKKILILLVVVSLYACKENDISPILPNGIVNTRIQKLALISSDERDTVFIRPSYDNNNKLTQLIESTLIVGSRIHKVSYNNTSIIYQPSDEIHLYNSIKFKYSEGKIDSVMYDINQIYSPNSEHIKRRIYKYDDRGRLKYFIVKLYNGKLDTIVRNFVYQNDKVISITIGDSISFYQKIDIVYQEEESFDVGYVNAITNYTWGDLGYGQLFYSPYYNFPLFIREFNCLGMGNNLHLIKGSRGSGFYIHTDGSKIEFDEYNDMEYKYDTKGRIIELPWQGPYADISKVLIYYFD